MTYQRIFVPIDKSEPARKALEEACKLATLSNATLQLAHIVDMNDFGWEFINPEDPEVEIRRRAAEELANKMLKKAADRASALGVAAQTQCLLPTHADIAAQLLEQAAAWRADLIVMGTHGREGIDHFLLGSVAEGVSRHAAVPVMLVRAAD